MVGVSSSDSALRRTWMPDGQQDLAHSQAVSRDRRVVHHMTGQCSHTVEPSNDGGVMIMQRKQILEYLIPYDGWNGGIIRLAWTQK